MREVWFAAPMLASLALTIGCSAGESRSEAASKAARWTLAHREIVAQADEDIEWFIVERVSNGMGGDYDPDGVLDLPLGIRAVYATWELEAEVSNGGFDQYFLNTDGVLADEAIYGFDLFGAHQTADLVTRALDVRDDMEALDRLDDEFYSITEPVSSLRVSYIRNNPGDF